MKDWRELKHSEFAQKTHNYILFLQEEFEKKLTVAMLKAKFRQHPEEDPLLIAKQVREWVKKNAPKIWRKI